MNISIDFGNTNTRFAGFESNTHLFTLSVQNEDLTHTILSYNPENLILSNVSSDQKMILQDFSKQTRVFEINKNLKLPIATEYKTMQTLGDDRLANVIAAWKMNKKSPSLVIDMGTCITYDIITENGTYLGGSISPGAQIRFKSLHQFTSRLPLVDFNPNSNCISNYKDIQQFPLNGKTTEDSIKSGVLHGISAEANNLIDRYRTIYNEITIFLTGGDAGYFEKQIKHKTFADPNLVLKGLNALLLYNIE